MSAPIKSVLVIGYGTMGRGIVATFANNGFDTTVLTRDPSKITDLPTGALAVSELPKTAPDLVIESIPEDMALKHTLFEQLEQTYGADTVLATNTSGLPLDEIAAPLAHKDRFLAVHYMQPADAFPLVEICRLQETSEDVLERTVAALTRSGKDPIVLQKPVIGFLINRLQHALLHEAYCMIEDGITTAADVDKIAKLGFGPRMCVTGLIEQKDISGLDVNAATQRSIVPDLYHTNTPCQMLQDMAIRGDLGIKTGKGFYDWTDRNIDAFRKTTVAKLDRIWRAISASD